MGVSHSCGGGVRMSTLGEALWRIEVPERPCVGALDGHLGLGSTRGTGGFGTGRLGASHALVVAVIGRTWLQPSL